MQMTYSMGFQPLVAKQDFTHKVIPTKKLHLLNALYRNTCSTFRDQQGAVDQQLIYRFVFRFHLRSVLQPCL